MPPKIRLITISVCIFIVVYVFELVRRRHLNEEYSMGWLITGILMLSVSIWIDLLNKITFLVGASTVTSTLFFLGLLFLVVICLHFSIRISNLTNQVRKLTQQQAILRHDAELKEKQKIPLKSKPESSQISPIASKTIEPLKKVS